MDFGQFKRLLKTFLFVWKTGTAAHESDLVCAVYKFIYLFTHLLTPELSNCSWRSQLLHRVYGIGCRPADIKLARFTCMLLLQ